MNKPSGRFLMTLYPTGDEIVAASVKVTPISNTDGDLAAKIEEHIEPVVARVYGGHTNHGHEIEVAIIKILKIHPDDEARLAAALGENGLPSNFPKKGEDGAG